MKYITDTSITNQYPSVISLGNFDGVHMGHRKIIQTANEEAAKMGVNSIVFSFFPHPSFVLHQKETVKLLFSREEKRKRIEQARADVYIEYPFTKQFAKRTPLSFIQDILVEQLKVKTIVVGEKFRFGTGQSGTIEALVEIGKRLNFEVIAVKSVQWDGESISSTRLRHFLQAGQLDIVNKLLEIPYGIGGTVVQGKKLGRQIGFPTINMIPDPDRLLPPNGVYITQTVYKEKIFSSVTNIGYNPTVNGKNIIIETYILDFDKNLYNESVEVYFLEYLRPEQKYNLLDALIDQIKMDVKNTEKYFSLYKNNYKT